MPLTLSHLLRRGTPLRAAGENEYGKTADRKIELAAEQLGFLGVESVRGDDGFGITVSYWASVEAIATWKSNAEHVIAREIGKRLWYQHYEMRVARVERAYAKTT
jgi:heme-degrading monooxygenase HmoA